MIGSIGPGARLPEAGGRRVLRSDYDTDPERRKAIVCASGRYLATEDVHPIVAGRFPAEGARGGPDVSGLSRDWGVCGLTRRRIAREG